MRLLTLTIFLLLSMAVQATRVPFVIKEVGDKFEALDASISAVNSRADGNLKSEVLRTTYSFATDGGVVGTIALGVSLPDNAVVTHCWYDVITDFESLSGDAGTIAINIPTDGDLQSATAISAGGNVYDAGLHECATKGNDPGDPSTYIKTTASRDISVVLGVSTITAGEMVINIRYLVTK